MATTHTNKEFLVSVCLVTYNQEQFIEKVIQGALMQETSFPFEIVIGEDHSSDGTLKICEDYQKQFPDKIRLLPSSINLGLKENFLRTFRACKGKYIAYLEGDDYWITQDKLQKQVTILEKDQDVSLVHTNFKLWNVAKNQITDHVISFQGICIREKNIGIDNIIAEFEGNFRGVKTSTCCYRKVLLESILKEDEWAFRNEAFPTQDFQLFLEMSMKGKFYFIDEDTTMIGLHDSLSAAQDETRRTKYSYGFYEIGIYYIKKYHLPAKTIQIWVRRELHYFLNIGFKNKDRQLVDSVVEKANSVNYALPFRQYLLYKGTHSSFFHGLIYPFWKFLKNRRNNYDL
ncbi:MAG: glycosyltransferase [Candidatus Symbiothrix sp.]|jgi:glycosyltransferase involved in cell wall biosynthesis|nr:glycosyltransferase [Candidatus Symbiothrix sp.]